MVYMKEFFEKDDFEKNNIHQKCLKNYRVCYELTIINESLVFEPFRG